MIQTCRSCGESIRWGTNDTTGKPMPVNAYPDPKHGNATLFQNPEGHTMFAVVPPAKAVAMREAGVPLYLSHFATCPQAANWRTNR